MVTMTSILIIKNKNKKTIGLIDTLSWLPHFRIFIAMLCFGGTPFPYVAWLEGNYTVALIFKCPD